MQISGRLKEIDVTKSFGANGFKKRDFVITTDEQYPQHIAVEATQDKCDLLDKFKVGQAVTVSINLRGREWVNPQGETKYFNSIQMWRIEGSQGSEQQDPRANSAVNKYNEDKNKEFKEEEHDDLPF